MIAAVVVTYAAPEHMLTRCLVDLRAAGGTDVIVVVDTGGGAVLDPALARPVVLLRTENRGYGAAANVGIGHALGAGATAVALLNDDVFVRPGWLAPLVDALATHGVGAGQPAIVVADREPLVVISLGVAIGSDGAGVDVGDGDELDARAPTQPIDAFTGGAVLLDAEFLRATGGFDERWFLYYEDIDLARRGHALGWSYRVVPASVVAHRRGASTSADTDRTRYLQERNRLWAAVRWADAATVGRALWLSVRRLRHPPRGVHARALAAGLAGAPVRVWERFRRRTVRQRPW